MPELNARLLTADIERHLPEVPRDAEVFWVIRNGRIACSGYGGIVREAAINVMRDARTAARRSRT